MSMLEAFSFELSWLLVSVLIVVGAALLIHRGSRAPNPAVYR